jgi:hypothetical protein
VPSAVFDLESETPEATEDGPVECLLVIVRGVLVESRGEVVAKVGEDLRSGFDQVDVVAIAFLRFSAIGLVVGPFRSDAVLDEATLLPLEEVELTIDELRESRASDPHSSSS